LAAADAVIAIPALVKFAAYALRASPEDLAHLAGGLNQFDAPTAQPPPRSGAAAVASTNEKPAPRDRRPSD
jgi:hypothetical protein